MKLSPIFLTALLLALLLTACKGPVEQEKTPVISLSLNEVAFGSAATSGTVSLTATGDWTASVSADAKEWLLVEPAKGTGAETPQTVTVTVSDNFAAGRTGKVVFSLSKGTGSAELTVAQSAVEAVTLAEFVKKPVSNDTWYTLRGTITSIESYDYGDIYVSDGTGEILVYGLTATRKGSNDKSFRGLNLKEGYVLTFKATRSEYRGEPQAGGTAYYLGHEPGPEPAPVYRDFRADATDAGWMELPETSADDGLVFIHHGMKIGSVPFRNYSAGWSIEHLVSRWVAYPMTRKAIGYGGRTDAWATDPLLSDSEQAVLNRSSYTPSNSYSRGHQIPSADRLAYEANLKTFYGTNIAPQMSSFNEGIWLELETKVRDWTKATGTDTLYVVTGCTVAGSTKTVFDNDNKPVTVPTGFYKTVLRLSGGNYSACAFFLEHKAHSGKNPSDFAVSVDELEEITGLNFFVNLPDDIEAAVEAAVPTKSDWWFKN